MELQLKADKRKILGRKVKKLRADGLLPAHVFGHNIATVHIQVNQADFDKVFHAAGETNIVNLKIDSQTRPVLIRGVQKHPLTDQFLHVDFYQVSLKEKVKVAVPLEFVGESPGVEKKEGLLLTPVSEIEIEALPTNIPDKIEVDISKLEHVGDQITVGDLKLDRTKVEVLADEDLVVANIGELVTKEAEEVLAAEAAEKEAAAAAEAAEAAPEEAAPAEEGVKAEEAPAEGAEKPDEKPAEEKKEE